MKNIKKEIISVSGKFGAYELSNSQTSIIKEFTPISELDGEMKILFEELNNNVEKEIKEKELHVKKK